MVWPKAVPATLLGFYGLATSTSFCTFAFHFCTCISKTMHPSPSFLSSQYFIQPFVWLCRCQSFLLTLSVVFYITFIHTVGRERFAGLNVRGFSHIEVFVEILSRCLGQKCFLFSIIKRGVYIHGKTFVVLLKTMKNTKVQPSKSFHVYSRTHFDRLYQSWILCSLLCTLDNDDVGVTVSQLWISHDCSHLNLTSLPYVSGLEIVYM